MVHVSAESDDEDVHSSGLYTTMYIQEQQVTFQDAQEHIPTLTEPILAAYAWEELLFFWTTTASFTVTHSIRPKATQGFLEYHAESRPRVLDEDGNEVGRTCKLGQHKTADAFFKDEIHTAEFLAIGRREMPPVPEEFQDEIGPPMVLALQVERNDAGIYSRVNFAEIRESVWERVRSDAKLVALG